MSRVAKKPIDLTSDVKFHYKDNVISIEGKKGSLKMMVHDSVEIDEKDGLIIVKPKKEDKPSWAMAGTMRSLINNMIIGVTDGYVKKLKLIGVGYRAAIKGNSLNLTLGYSHPIEFEIPEGIKVEAPSQTELVVSGFDKQLVGQVSAKIRSFRPPEPYKGKGVRYADEQIKLKEAKKK